MSEELKRYKEKLNAQISGVENAIEAEINHQQENGPICTTKNAIVQGEVDVFILLSKYVDH